MWRQFLLTATEGGMEKEGILDLLMSKKGEESGLTPTSSVEVTPPVPNCCSGVQHQSLRILMEDNIRMRQAMNTMLLTLTRWIRQNKKQTQQARLLMQMLKESNEESEKERSILRQNLEDMAMQMKAVEADLAVERQNRLLANREKEVAKQMIFKLQEENWGLRKARSRTLVSRDGSSHSPNGFPSPLSSSRFDCPR